MYAWWPIAGSYWFNRLLLLLYCQNIHPWLSNILPAVEIYTPDSAIYSLRSQQQVYMPYVTACGVFDPPTHYSIYIYVTLTLFALWFIKYLVLWTHAHAFMGYSVSSHCVWWSLSSWLYIAELRHFVANHRVAWASVTYIYWQSGTTAPLGWWSGCTLCRWPVTLPANSSLSQEHYHHLQDDTIIIENWVYSNYLTLNLTKISVNIRLCRERGSHLLL